MKDLEYEEQTPQSTFNGTAGGCFVVKLLCCLVVILTLGLGSPWAICMWYEWRTENLVIDGKRLVFDGRAGRLFLRFAWWFFLTIITLGHYAWTVRIKIHDWLTEHTHFENNPYRKYYEIHNNESAFGGDQMEHIRLFIKQLFLVVFTLGFGMPKAVCMQQKWRLGNTVIDGKQVAFDGTGKKLFWLHIGTFWLTVLTLGIAGSWRKVKILRWIAEHTHFE